MHSTIPFIPTGQGMRCRSKHNHMRGTFNEATLESMLMITFLQPTAFAVPVIPHKISKELIGLTQLLTYLSRFICRQFC